ncbi:hypothetical protein Pmani_017890 [Petrolisthes manimaculis]|uniref:Uncharacterized protein n=1 Tax=Petrolisthes manimaculis TaxID=1843537 RepID=A0AAE1TSJ6_9EUCA|nr:hypothetical protein Pmani_033589 [Petrolisthes manimaculis]KAK4310533.1 hypothetical protein Pmani_017890 [Petrolisthes manimaculis]
MVTSCELDLQPQQQRHHLHDYNAATEAAVREHAVLGMILPESQLWNKLPPSLHMPPNSTPPPRDDYAGIVSVPRFIYVVFLSSV